LPEVTKQHVALRRLEHLPFNYAEVGATEGILPPGFRHLEREQSLGRGQPLFEDASRALMSWDVHRRAGLSVQASSVTVALSAAVRLGYSIGPITLHVPCRVVAVIDEPARQGFAYGSLVGHPEAGEERFTIDRDAAGEVVMRIRAFSRPATWWSRIAAPVAVRIQDQITERYLRAFVG
jgi:uncharacterized protein (UPF0548 family)